MSTLGIGQGLERGMGVAAQAIMKGLQMRQDWMQFNRRIEFLRGQAGLQPSYKEVEPDEGAGPDTKSTAPGNPMVSPAQTLTSAPQPISAAPVSPADGVRSVALCGDATGRDGESVQSQSTLSQAGVAVAHTRF